jgi:cysteine desulfurase/selenocysteine lyase
VTDVQELDCDFLAFSGHKIYGPYGIGALYGKMELLEKMNPYQGGGSMISQVTFEKTTWAAVPHKFEAGTPAISGAIGFGEAIKYLQTIGIDAAAAHERMLVEAATRELKSIPGLRLFGDTEHKAAIISFVMEGAHASDIGSLLDQQGIAIRAGHHCCQPLMKRLGVPATARASFAIYNTLQEVEALKQGLIKAKEFFS